MVRQPVLKDDDGDDRDEQFETVHRGDTSQISAARALDSDDPRFDDELRPQRLDDVVGQRKLVARLKIMLEAAKRRGEPLGHLLLDGPPGLGKTTFATVLPKELGTELLMTSGPVLAAPKDLVPCLTNASHGAVLFIDEIHRMPPAVEEFLYPAMEDFRIDITLGEGVNARTINIELKRFTVVGATTRSGLLTAPLRDRFVNRLHLDFYDENDIAEIVTRNAKKLRSDIDAEAAYEIARRSRGTPRKANNHLRWARDVATVNNPDGRITREICLSALKMAEIDEQGLDEQDRRYLLTLANVYTGGPAGIQAIAHSMNLAADTLEDEVEPYLLRCGFVLRTSRGRMITAEALKHLGITPPAPKGDSVPGTLF